MFIGSDKLDRVSVGLVGGVFGDLGVEAAEGFVFEGDVFAKGGVAEEVFKRSRLQRGKGCHECIANLFFQADEIGIAVEVSAAGSGNGLRDWQGEWDVALAQHQLVNDIVVGGAGDEIEGVFVTNVGGVEVEFLPAQILFKPVDLSVFDAEGLEADI